MRLSYTLDDRALRGLEHFAALRQPQADIAQDVRVAR
jgi:hypothetical protein